jgi:hypothetical protein
VSITAVDTVSTPPVAIAMMRSRETIQIDISHYVGAIQVTPAVGEQWLAIRDRGVWKLDTQLPFNTGSMMEEKFPGQTRIGSSGPTELHGSQININAPLRLLAVTTANRPDAGSIPAGSNIFDTTLNRPLWSDGTQWRDAAGSLA